jgi:hypothetical protein
MLTDYDPDVGLLSPPAVLRALALSARGAAAAREVFLGDFRFLRRLLWVGLGCAAASSRGVSKVLPRCGSSHTWREVANKIGAYRTFGSASRWLHMHGDLLSIAAVPERLRKLDRYAAVWAMEGASYYHARRGGRLRTSMVQRMPRAAWLTLHTGAGLAWAEAALRSARSAGVQHMLDDFWDCCRREALDGYHEAAFEALGLVAVTLYPHLVSGMADCLGRASDDRSGLFWHGVGRGLYFLPAAFLPWRVAQRRAPMLAGYWPATGTARASAWAGLAWAVTLVNMRDPEVVENWLLEYGGEVRWHDALRNGLTSALIVWLAASPRDPSIERFGRFRPVHASLSSVHLWDDIALRAWRDARRLETAAGWGDLPPTVFRLRPLPT